MRRRLRPIPPAALAALAALACAAAAPASPAAAWQATPRFVLHWQPVPGGTVGYRFLNVPWDPAPHVLSYAEYLSTAVPPPPGADAPPPGAYLVETWVTPPGGAPAGQAIVSVPFDDGVPQPAQPRVPPGWLDGDAATPVTIEHPAPPFPISGVSGYAIAIGSRPDQSPCAAESSCTPAEIDLPLGIGDDRFNLPLLPDGISYLTVVAVSGSGVASAPRSVALPVDGAPPRIHFAGVPSGWAGHPVRIGAIAEDPASGTAPAGANGPFTAISIDGGRPRQVLGGRAEATVSGEGVHLVEAWARDRFGNTGSPAGPPATVRIDETPPRVSFAARQRPGDPELIEATVADALAGPSPDRGSIEVRPLHSRRRFQPLPTRHAGAVLSARWNSDDYPAGSYEFRVAGFDAAGNETRSTQRAGGAPMVLRNPVKTPTRIASGFGGRRLVWQRCRRLRGDRRCHRETITAFAARPARRTVPYGRPLRFGGVLRTAAGDPLGGQPVQIVETFATGARPARRRTLATTDAEGRFGSWLAPGPSRRVEAVFPGTGTLTRSRGRAVTMAVRAGLRLQASASTARIGGRPVVFRGRLLAGAAAIPRTGRPVQLQFRVPGGAWSEFRTVQTDRHGRFRYPYAFTDDDSRGVRFQFRAVSPEQADWPYRPGSSRPVAVTGY